MIIIGRDYHPGFQQTSTKTSKPVAWGARRQGRHGHARWFGRLLAELQFELWIGDAAAICTKRVRKQKTDGLQQQRQFAQRAASL
jgi:hypothetical protein